MNRAALFYLILHPKLLRYHETDALQEVFTLTLRLLLKRETPACCDQVLFR